MSQVTMRASKMSLRSSRFDTRGVSVLMQLLLLVDSEVFNPDVVPYDKVIFLDLDMIVLRNIDELFDLRTPAGMSTMKNDHVCLRHPDHGQRLDPRCNVPTNCHNFSERLRFVCRACYVNAGTMVTAPSKELFQLLEADVSEPDPAWHIPAWSPEQKYLSNVMAGEWSHLSQLYNFEVQLHSGVPVTNTWHTAEVTDVAVAHFSGYIKAWDKEADQELPFVADNESSRTQFQQLPLEVQKRAKARCMILHAEWHKMYSMALQRWGSHSQQENQKGHLLVSGRCRVGLNLDPGNGLTSLQSWASILFSGCENEVFVCDFMPGEEVVSQKPLVTEQRFCAATPTKDCCFGDLPLQVRCASFGKSASWNL
eukprot:symbB.v1.2.039197.t1/scaffold6379.1/size18568/3